MNRTNNDFYLDRKEAFTAMMNGKKVETKEKNVYELKEYPINGMPYIYKNSDSHMSFDNWWLQSEYSKFKINKGE